MGMMDLERTGYFGDKTANATMTIQRRDLKKFLLLKAIIFEGFIAFGTDN